jgi:hypothetical protein
VDSKPQTIAFKARVNDEAIASYRYRVLEPIRFLSARGHAVELFDEARFDHYGLVVFSKAYKAEDQVLAKRLKAAGKRVLLDLCDDHFFNPRDLEKYRRARQDLLAMIALADGVVCSTPVLAKTIKDEAGLAVSPSVAPDVYEQAPVTAAQPGPPDRPAKLLWFGRHGSPNAEAGMADLSLIQDDLARAAARRPFELVVMSDSREAFETLAKDFPVPLGYVDWNPASFAAELGQCDGVVIPLSDNRFVAAKTHNRLSLALSAGVPVVADRIDAYTEFEPFCWLGEWREGLEAVLMKPQEARARAAGARAYLEAHWSAEAVAPQWEAALGLNGQTKPAPARIMVEEGASPPDIDFWLARERRNSRAWLLAGDEAPVEAAAVARAEGMLVLSLGRAFARVEADLALVIDTEILEADAELLERNARFLLVPNDLHQRGWASGRSLNSWAVDLPVLRRFAEEDRLVSFGLWTGGAGVFGDVEGEEIPLRLLANAGVREARTLGLAPRAPSCTGFEGLASLWERTAGGVPELVRERRIRLSPYTQEMG